MSKKSNKVKFGLKNCHYAKATFLKQKNRRPCLYCERNKHNRLVIGIKNPTQPCTAEWEKEGGPEVIFPVSNLAKLPKPDCC